jgi:hypothetical protein
VHRLLLILAVFLSTVLHASAATYHIATTGNDNNAGTLAAPFATLAKGLTVLQAGDTLYLRGGVYNQRIHSDTQTIPVGTAGNVITIASYPGETATLRPSSGQSIITFYGYNIAYAIKYITLDRLVLDAVNCSDYALVINGAPGAVSEPHDIIFQNGEIKNSDPPPNVQLYGYNNVIRNSAIHHSGGSYGIYMGGHDNIIEGNDIYDNAGYAVQIYEGTPGRTADNIIIRNNKMHGNGYIRGLLAVIVSSGTGSKVYNNLIYNNYGGIHITGTSAGIYNNTIYNNSPAAGMIMGFSGGASAINPIIRNNILWNNAGGISDVSATGETISNNLNPSTNSVNPLFVNQGALDFRLQSTSPAINAGFTVAAVPTDIVGTTRPQGASYDIGAYELITDAPPPMSAYYIATTGNDTNAGTEAFPFATLAKAFTVMAAGTTAYLRAGTYTQALVGAPSGTSWTTPITIASYPNETATLQPSGVWEVVSLPTQSYVILDRLTLDAINVNEGICPGDGKPGDPNCDGVAVRLGGGSGQFVRIQNSDIKNGYSANIVPGPSTEILNSQIHGSRWSYGVWAWAANVLITGNTIYNNAGYGLHLYNVSGVNAAMVYKNRLYGNGFTLLESAIKVGTGQDSKIYNNLIYANYGGIDVYGTNEQIYNNTIYNNASRPGIEYVDATSPVVKNNILWQNSAGIVDTSSTGKVESNNLVTDPEFTNPGTLDLTLLSTSDAIDAGANLSTAGVTIDFLGVARPYGSAYDIGAYEFVGTPSTNSPRRFRVLRK